MLPKTVERVARHTPDDVNQHVRSELRANVAHYRTASVEEIDRRLEELDEEWNIERALEANAASFALVGLGLGTVVSKKFLALPAVVAGFLLQHALQGWCPPVPILRRMGFRTPREIETERQALKRIRGDHGRSGTEELPSTDEILRAVEA